MADDRITIIGAGMAGLLAANMLRRSNVHIIEKQESLPNNHSAVLRFRTPKVSEQTHIPFRKVRVFKSVDDSDPLRAAMRYSKKVTWRYEPRSLLNLEPVDRYIAPDDFISQMADGLSIEYGRDALILAVRSEKPLISTLPMPLLMDALSYDGARPNFDPLPGWTINMAIDGCDVYATRYYSDPETTLYRASITGNNLVLEFMGLPMTIGATNSMIDKVVEDFGIDPNDVGLVSKAKESAYAKLRQLSDEDRAKANAFMFHATNVHNVYSLGRFAKWQSGLLLDDIVDDVIKIERWIKGSNYDIQKEMK